MWANRCRCHCWLTATHALITFSAMYQYSLSSVVQFTTSIDCTLCRAKLNQSRSVPCRLQLNEIMYRETANTLVEEPSIPNNAFRHVTCIPTAACTQIWLTPAITCVDGLEQESGSMRRTTTGTTPAGATPAICLTRNIGQSSAHRKSRLQRCEIVPRARAPPERASLRARAGARAHTRCSYGLRPQAVVGLS